MQPSSEAAGTRPNFDRIARPYRWFEYLTFGLALHRCRLCFLPELLHARKALILGDGDGRFLARLLAHNANLRADAVDLSSAMLDLLRRRCAFAATRLTTHHSDARTFQPSGAYDLVVTHFFLDCLTPPELDRLLARLAPHLDPSALWLISDFRIPGGLLRLPAQVLVSVLYLAFRVLTGLRTTHLPDHASALHRAGFTLVRQRRSLRAILTSELWQRHPSASNPQQPQGDLMSTSFPTPPSPVPDLPPSPGTNLPTGPATDPIPDPEPPSPSLPEPDLGVFQRP